MPSSSAPNPNTESNQARHRSVALALAIGLVLALACALAGPWLTPPALARWTFQMHEQDEVRALLGLLGIRHLPLFIMAYVAGRMIIRILGRSSAPLHLVAACPYLAYVCVQGVLDSLGAGETAFSWISYEPSYFIWPHFVAVPSGLLAAVISERLRKSRGSPAMPSVPMPDVQKTHQDQADRSRI